MSTEFIAIVILLFMGGLIAYFGDWLGFTMGKRRLSVFGLRPRHTARVFTITSGAVIAVLTFLTLLWLDSGFRIAVRRGAQIVHRNHMLAAENKVLQSQTTTAIEERRDAQSAEASANQARNIVNAQYEADERKLAQDQVALTKTDAQLRSTRDSLTATSESLARDRVQLAQARTQSSTLAHEIAFDQTFVSNVVPQIRRNIRSTPIYVSGQEVGRAVFRSGQSVEEIKQQIRGFLLHLSVEAQGKGAARGGNGRFVEVATFKFLKPGARPTIANESDSVDALADEIGSYNKDNSVVVVADALGNAFVGEQAVITLRPYANHLVIPRGAVLGQITVPSTDSDPGRILDDLQQLLQRTRSSAIRAGVIPVENPQGAQSEVGETSVADLFTVAEQIRAVKGPATVTASAAQDTYSADRLHLAFTVAPAIAQPTTTAGP